MSKRKFAPKFLDGFLALVWWGGLLLIGASVLFAVGVGQSGAHLLDSFVRVLVLSVSLLVVYELRKVVRSVLETDPFRLSNIKSFRIIGYSVIVLGIMDAAISYRTYEGSLQFLATSYGAVKPAIIVYLVLGCLAFILAEVFQSALDIKNENELII